MSHNFIYQTNNRSAYIIDYARRQGHDHISNSWQGARGMFEGTCSNHTPTASVYEWSRGWNQDPSDGDIGPGNWNRMPSASRYTLDLSGWEIKTDPITNKRYIDVYLCIRSFMAMLTGDNLPPPGVTHDEPYGVDAAQIDHTHPPANHDHHNLRYDSTTVQFTGHRIVFYKSKGIDAEQTKLFKSKLGTDYNINLKGNDVNCTDAPSDEDTTIGRCCFTWTPELEGRNGACSNYICAINPDLCGASACNWAHGSSTIYNSPCKLAVIDVFENGGIATSAFTDLKGNVYQPGQPFPPKTICNHWQCSELTYKQCKDARTAESPLGVRAPWREDDKVYWNKNESCVEQFTTEADGNQRQTGMCEQVDPSAPNAPVRDSWKYQCGNIGTERDFYRSGANWYVTELKTAWDRWADITEKEQPILNYSSNTSTPESVIYDTGCIKEAHCIDRSQILGRPSPWRIYPQGEHKDSHLEGRTFRVTEDDAEFDDIVQDYWMSTFYQNDIASFREGHDTGPYIYFIILPNCEYEKQETTGVSPWRQDLGINIGCTPRGALPCNFTDQECDLCLRGAPETWDYKEYSPEIDDNGESPFWQSGYQWDPSGLTGMPYMGSQLGANNIKCKSDEEYDCQGRCFPSSWLNDTICHSDKRYEDRDFDHQGIWNYQRGRFWHPQACNPEEGFDSDGVWKGWKWHGGWCEETDGEVFYYATINLNCPRFPKQVENCSWKNNSQTPLCKGICCEIYKGVFTGACSIKPRNECKLYRNPGLGISPYVVRLDHMRNNMTTDNPVLEFYNQQRSSTEREAQGYGRGDSVSDLITTPSIELEGGYFWEISSNDTVESADTCSVCSTLKGTKTDGGCGYFGCCDEVGVSDFVCSPSGFWTNRNAFATSQEFSSHLFGTESWSLIYGFDDAREPGVYDTFGGLRGSPAGWIQEMLVKQKSNGYFSGIAAPEKDEIIADVKHIHKWDLKFSEISPDYTQNNMGVRACCIDGECSLRTIDNCKQAGGFFHINLVVCNDIFCEPDRVGRCCELSLGIPTGDCLEITRTACDGIVGKNWLIDEQGDPVACKNPIILLVGGTDEVNGVETPFESPFWSRYYSPGANPYSNAYGLCRFNTQCASLTRDSRACCLGDTCETLLISHCLELGGTPDHMRYTCNQGTPVEGSTPTDIKYLNCAFSHTLGETKWWCNPKCVDKVCDTTWFGTGEEYDHGGWGNKTPHNHSWSECCTLGWDAWGLGSWEGPKCAGKATNYGAYYWLYYYDEQNPDIGPHGDKGLELWEECSADYACGLGPFYCGSPKSGPCCEAHNTPFCSDRLCCRGVCQLRPECCEFYWSEECAILANAFKETLLACDVC